MLTRRSFIKLVGATALAGLGLTSYAFGIEPRFRLAVTRYRLTPPGWPSGQKRVRVAAVGVVPGTLGEPEANRIFTLSLPDLELIDVADMPNDVTAGDPNLASNLLHDGDTVYFYGNRVGEDGTNLARAPADDIVDGTYEYWTGDGWSTDADQAAPIEVDEPENPGDLAIGRVIDWGDGYLMTGKMGYLWVFTDELYAWYADDPS